MSDYIHKPVMGEHIWNIGIPSGEILSVLCVFLCFGISKPTTTCEIGCSDIYSKNIEIQVPGIVVNYKYKQDSSGYWVTECTPLDHNIENYENIRRMVDEFSCNYWSWKIVKYLT